MSIELRGIVEAILSGSVRTQAELESMKRAVCRKLGLASLPSNADLLGLATAQEREMLKMLVRKPTQDPFGSSGDSGHDISCPMPSRSLCPMSRRSRL